MSLPGFETAKPKAPLLNTKLRWFMLAIVLANIAWQMYGPILPLYLRGLNASVLDVGLFFTLSQIIPLALQILGGWISDTLGRLRSIALGSLAGVLSYIGLLLTPSWQWVLVGEGFGAVTRSLVGPSFGAFIAEQSAEENRARVFAITDTIYTLVVIVGPPLGGWLVDHFGFRFMLVCAGLLYTLATIIRVAMARLAARSQPARGEGLSLTSLRSNLGTIFALVLGGGVLTWLVITDGVRDLSASMSFTLLPVYMEDIGRLTVTQIGWLSSIMGVASMVVTLPGGWLADKKGERAAIALGFLLDFAALMVFLNAASFWGYALAWALFGVGGGIMSPAYNSLTSKVVPEKVRGTAFGLLSTSLGVISLPAPAIGARLWESINPRAPFLITAAVSLVTILPVWLKFKLPAQRAGGDGCAQASEPVTN